MPYFSRKKVTLWNIFFQYSSLILLLASQIILVPIYLKYISIPLYGAWLATGNILVWLTLVDSGLSVVLQQKVASAYGDKNKILVGQIITNSTILSVIVTVLIIIIGMLLAESITNWVGLDNLNDKEELGNAIEIAIIGTGLIILSSSFTAISLGLLSSKGINSVILSVTALAIIASLILILNGYGILALAMEILIKGVGFTIGAIVYLLYRIHNENIILRFSKKILIDLSHSMSYTFFSRLGTTLSENIDLFFVAKIMGPEFVTLLAMTKRAPESSRKFVERPAIAFMPAVSHLMGEGKIDRAREVLLRLFLIILWVLGLFTAGFVTFNEVFVGLWVGQELFAGKTVSMVICLLFFISVIAGTTSNLCYSLGNIKGNSIASIIQTILTGILLYIGITNWGLLGAVLAPVLAILCVGFWYYPYSIKSILNIRKNDAKKLLYEILKILICMFFMIIIFNNVNIANWGDFVIQVILFCLFYISIALIISKSFYNEFKNLIQRVILLSNEIIRR